MSFEYSQTTMNQTLSSPTAADMGHFTMPDLKAMKRLDKRRASVEEVDDDDEHLIHNVGGADVIVDTASWAMETKMEE